MLHFRPLNHWTGVLQVSTVLLILATVVEQSSQWILEAPQVGSNSSNNCGTTDDLAKRVEICSKPAIDIVEGILPVWPKNLNDVGDLCGNIQEADYCIRDEGRRCAKGFYRTIVSTLRTSIHKVRKRDCIVNKYPTILKTMNCIEQNKNKFRTLMALVTNKALVVENQMTDVKRKMIGVCCSVSQLQEDMDKMLQSICPENKDFVIKLYEGVVDDVVKLICRNVQCDRAFDGYKIPKVKLNPDGTVQSGLLSSVLRIVFSLDKSDTN